MNQATMGTEDKGKAREVLFVEIGREESDADTEAQEEMGWRSGSVSVHHLESYGAEQSTKVSREAGNRGPMNSLPRSQRVKELPVRRNSEGLDQKKFPISKNPRLDQSQDQFQVAAELTPFDMSPAKFEGKLDSEFVPMDVEEVLLKKPINDGGKLSMRHPEGLAWKVVQGRPKGGKTQSDVVKGLMEQELMLHLQDIIAILPTMRRNLVAALRAMQDNLPEDIGREPTAGEEGLKKTLTEEGSVRNLFVFIYFSHFKLFLPTNTHPPNTCSHFRYDLTTCSLPLISFHFHHSHQVQTIANTSEVNSKIYQRQELSTREALHQAPSPIQSCIARLRQSLASTPTPPRTHDVTLYHEESSPRGLPMSTIPHDGMKRR